MNHKPFITTFIFIFLTTLLWGCTMTPAHLNVEGYDQVLVTGDILDTPINQVISFDQLMAQLNQVRIVYVGESHSNRSHHKIQLKVIRALGENDRKVGVGMEMFDHTYQHKLDRWVAGEWDWPTFLKEVHWYANWRYNDALYKDILIHIQAQKLRLTGLNIPFCLPPKIAIGGLDSLSEAERALLPKTIDTTDDRHRAYVEKIFKQHHIKGREDFDYFYAAQCAWEDGMAQAVAENAGENMMVVLIGNGHIVYKFGVPNRAHKRNGASFRTIYLATPGEDIDREAADFIWVGEAMKAMPHMHM